MFKILKETALLKNAINQYQQNYPNDCDNIKWIGTIGIPTDEISTKVCKNIETCLIENYDSIPVMTDDTTFIGSYKNYCKQILWPTLHYQIPDNSYSKVFEGHSWNH